MARGRGETWCAAVWVSWLHTEMPNAVEGCLHPDATQSLIKHVMSTRHVTRYKACEQNMHALHTWNSSYSQWLFILPLPPWS